MTDPYLPVIISGSGTITGGTDRYSNVSGSYSEEAKMLSATSVSGTIALTINE